MLWYDFIKELHLILLLFLECSNESIIVFRKICTSLYWRIRYRLFLFLSTDIRWLIYFSLTSSSSSVHSLGVLWCHSFKDLRAVFNLWALIVFFSNPSFLLSLRFYYKKIFSSMSFRCFKGTSASCPSVISFYATSNIKALGPFFYFWFWNTNFILKSFTWAQKNSLM